MDSATFTDYLIESIISLNSKFILTTNYDKLLENA